MTNCSPRRRLAAILAADMVGYSGLMERDEAGTVARLKSDREALIDPMIARHGGVTIRLAGDGALVEFPSVVEAVQCAIDIQRGMPERNAARTDEAPIVFRIGVNIGDIIVEEDNLHGEGINVAARLESLADPGGILVSEEVARHVDGKVTADVQFVEEANVKNIERPVRMWRVALSTATSTPSRPPKRDPKKQRGWHIAVPLAIVVASATVGLLWYQPWAPRIGAPRLEGTAFPPPSKPSIAVLPFENMSADPEQEYFSDGVSEDIITELSQLSNLVVIARNSSFSYKGENTKVQEIGRDLGVSHVLEGSVRRAGERLRITAQLVDASSGHHLWAERYDRAPADVFALQDEITRKIVAALSVQLVGDEAARLARRATENFEAYDLFLQGQRQLNVFTRESFAAARATYRKAISLDPEFARAYGALAIAIDHETLYGWSESPGYSLDRALTLARKGESIDPGSPQVLWALGYIHMSRREFSDAFDALHRAVELAPNYADGYGLLALISNNTGHAEDAVRYVKKGMALNPHYSWEYPYNLGRAQYALGDYESCVENLQAATERNEFSAMPRIYLAACYVRLDTIEDAEWEIMQLEVINPEFSLRHLKQNLALVEGPVKENLLADLRAAGMAE